MPWLLLLLTIDSVEQFQEFRRHRFLDDLVEDSLKASADYVLTRFEFATRVFHGLVRFAFVAPPVR